VLSLRYYTVLQNLEAEVTAVTMVKASSLLRKKRIKGGSVFPFSATKRIAAPLARTVQDDISVVKAA
jgi:hypothetical protein